MQDLNDLYYFAQVVDHGGFAAAARALGVPKSKLSRRVAQLEKRLGVGLLRRSTRRFSVTEAGQEYHRHCVAVVAEAEAAQEAIDRNSAEPRGLVRVSCPIGLMQSRIAGIVSRYLAAYPRVRLHIEATNRRVDVIAEGFDVALRVRPPPLDDSELVLRLLEDHGSVLVASPQLFVDRAPPSAPDDLADFPTLDMTQAGDMRQSGEAHFWRLTGPAGATHDVYHRPRLVTDELMTLREAALDGLGVAAFPHFLVGDDLAAGRLLPVLPGWEPPRQLVHAVFPSRRGLLPAIRLFINQLAAEFAEVPAPPPAGSR
jgi:DNA-binding transcriptional LysR family regulator